MIVCESETDCGRSCASVPLQRMTVHSIAIDLSTSNDDVPVIAKRILSKSVIARGSESGRMIALGLGRMTAFECSCSVIVAD